MRSTGALDQQAIARELLPAGDPGLRLWATRNPWRPALTLLRCYAFFVAAFAFLAIERAPWAGVLAFLVIGTQQYALFILAHDAMHGSLVRDKKLNDLLSDLFLFAPLGMSLRDQRPNHLDHHWLLGSESDPDRYLHASSNKTTRGAFVFFLSGLRTFPRTVLKVSLGANKEGSWFSRLARALARRAPMLIVQALIVFGISRILPWWCYFVLWVLPVYALVFVPDEIRAFCEHAQPMLPDRAADPSRLVTFRPNRIERIVFSPLNMNHHAEHHLWPYVPYYNLPALAPHVGNSPHIEVRGGYVAFLWLFFRRLPFAEERAVAARGNA